MNFRASSFAGASGSAAAAAIVVIIVWVISLFGVTVPTEVTGAFGVLIGFTVTLLVSSLAPHTAPDGWTPPVEKKALPAPNSAAGAPEGGKVAAAGGGT